MKSEIRDLIAFWIFGLANNYASVLMLSAAEDMIRGENVLKYNVKSNETAKLCQDKVRHRQCNSMSTGTILIADMLPTVIIKFAIPFFMHKIPYGFQHLFVCVFQAISLLIVGFSTNVYISIVGVIFASVGGGIGETCYLALTSHYTKNTVSMWSSGTGGAGIIGAAAYAILTEPHFVNISSRTTLLIMLITPVFLAIAYWFLLTPSPLVYRASLNKPHTWIIPKGFTCSNLKSIKPIAAIKSNSVKSLALNLETINTNASKQLRFYQKLKLITPLLRYMIPLAIVYFGQYMFNQGFAELIEFDCSSGFNLSKSSQYRWFQTIYQIGVFISRSSVNLIQLSAITLIALPFIQISIIFVLFLHAIYTMIPHIFIIFLIIFCEGIIGGISYVNTFDRIHKEAKPEVREFSLAISSLSNSFGILMSGFVAIPVHTYVCSLSLQKS